MKKEKVIYYSDELNEEFAPPKIKARKIDANYKYSKGIIFEVCSYFLQNVLSMPIKVGYSKLKFGLKYVGKEKLKEFKNTGYFVYANHTQPFADTFIPSVAIYPKRNFLIVNPVNISLKGTRTAVEMLGAIPLPGDIAASKNFLEIIRKRIENNCSITIYPEAHIWPYYTKIRPFKETSFRYPVEFKKPTFCITNTYHKNEKSERVKIVSYIDGPFFPDDGLNEKEKRLNLRNKVYEVMNRRSQNSNVEVIKYIKK